MKQSFLRRLGILAVSFILGSCAPHHVPFNEADFARSVGPGSGTVTGQAFRTLIDESTVTIDHCGIVRLMPVNAYTEEIVKRKYEDAAHMMRPDSRMAKYVRKMHPDDEGSFTFHNVPPGDYYVSCHALWTDPATTYDADNNPMETTVQDGQWLYATVSVKNGQTEKISFWHQGN